VSPVTWLRALLRREPAERARWVVVDCETSGLDAASDRLLSVAAVAVSAARIGPADWFEAGLAQAHPSPRENILVHGIGAARQRSGDPAETALAAFVDFVGNAPCVAFHAAFDEAVIARATRATRLRAPRPWLDVAGLLPVVFPGKVGAHGTLDEWLAAFAIDHPARHDALGDAYATAQLFLVALREARKQGFGSVQQVLGAARSSRWTPGGA
jgi:DNA polymerase-3 subunit epsilon